MDCGERWFMSKFGNVENSVFSFFFCAIRVRFCCCHVYVMLVNFEKRGIVFLEHYTYFNHKVVFGVCNRGKQIFD